MIYRSLAEMPRDFGPCAITIGNFDGVHRGSPRRSCGAWWQWRAKKAGSRPRSPSIRIPPSCVAPARAPQLLTTPDQRARMMLEQGIDADPDSAVHAGDRHADAGGVCARDSGGQARARGPWWWARTFVSAIGRPATSQTLEELGERYSFETEIVAAGGVAESHDLQQRDPAVDRGRRCFTACRMLGRPYMLARRGGARRRHRVEADRTHAEPGHQGGGVAQGRRVCDAHARMRERARVAVHHQRRLSADVQRPATSPSKRTCYPRWTARRREKFRWNFSVGCVRSASSRTRKR